MTCPLRSLAVAALASRLACLSAAAEDAPANPNLSAFEGLGEGRAIGDWSVTGGTCRVADDGRASYILTGAPYLVDEGRVEATVTVAKRLIAGGWAAAGVMVSGDPGNLWTLTLVEGPDGRRYTELMERCQDVHQAQATGLTRLAAVAGGFGGTWEYGRSYRLRLSLAPDRVTGEVVDVVAGQTVARHGWLLGGAPAVREGWATLRAEQLEATFTAVKVMAAPPSDEANRKYPPGRRGCIGVYAGDDLPGAEAAPRLDGLTDALHRAGFATAALHSTDIAAPGALAFPGLRCLAADARRLPAGALRPLRRWMQQGGVLVSLTAPAFGSLFWPGKQGWLAWDDYSQQKLADLGRGARPVLDWSGAEPARWRQTLGGEAKVPATVTAAGEDPDHRQAVSILVPHFSGGWWSLDRSFDAPPGRAGEALVCFWAKGDVHTPQVSLELREADGSRWVATVPLTPDWHYRVLAPQAFVYWPDNPSKGRGGAGDEVRLANAVCWCWGISGTHTNAVLMSDATEHHLTIGSVALAPAGAEALAALAPAPRPDLEAVSPGYKLFEINGAARFEATALGKLWGMPASWPAAPAYGAVERPGGEGLDRGRLWRWVPLVKAVDSHGADLGAPLSLVLSEAAPLPRCAWVSVGALRAADLASPEMQAAVARAVDRLASGPLLFEGGADRFLAYPDEALTVGARVVSYAAEAADGQIAIRVLGGHGELAAPEVRLPVTIAPRQMVAVRQTLAPQPVGDYTVVTALLVDGRTTDVISHPLTVAARSAAPPESEIVRREGGGLTLGGRPWHPIGVNYWPHNLGGTPTGAYSTGWLDPVSYQPSVVEADLAQMEKLGFHAIAAVGAEIHWGASEDTPQLRDLLEFLGRCQRHHIKVILFVPGLDPRGRDDEAARRVLRAVRHHPALMGYDIAWEPGYGAERRVYTPQWRDWLAQQYGSLAQAETALGAALPRAADGQVDAPPDSWLVQDGPQRAIAAAYRAFMDYQLGIEYRHSAAVVRDVDPWHLVGFRGSTPDSVLGFKPVEQRTVLHFMDWAGPEGYDVPAYGKLSPAPWVASRGLCTRMLSFLSGGKPVVWMEFGMPIYPNGTDWNDAMVHFTPGEYQYQADEGSQFWRMQAESGAWGSFAWWYPGGFRVGENSDCGFVDPNNVPRPVAEAARRLLPGLTASETRRADTWLDFKPESNPGGWMGEYLRLRPDYERLREAGKTVDVRTAGVGLTSADCPLLDPAGRPWPGAGPLRYLDGVFERLRIRVDGGPWQEIELPVAPGKAIAVRLPRGGAVDLEAWAGNVAEATWQRGQVTLSLGGVTVPLEADTPFQGSGHFVATRAIERLDGATTLQLRLNAGGRAPFGEILALALSAG
jgi:hypothetical protein